MSVVENLRNFRIGHASYEKALGAFIRCSEIELVTEYQPPIFAGWPSSCSLPDVGRQLLTLGVGVWNTSIAH